LWFRSIKFISPRRHGGTEKNQALPVFLRVSVPPWWILYRSFKVVSANNANTSDAIQKRTITFDSDQPSNSK
jgi:hypothetical protein